MNPYSAYGSQTDRILEKSEEDTIWLQYEMSYTLSDHLSDSKYTLLKWWTVAGSDK